MWCIRSFLGNRRCRFIVHIADLSALVLIHAFSECTTMAATTKNAHLSLFIGYQDNFAFDFAVHDVVKGVGRLIKRVGGGDMWLNLALGKPCKQLL